MPEQHNASGQRVLIVEDDPVSRRALRLILLNLGYRVDSAGTVAEGMERLEAQQFAILDIDLPDGRGTAVLARIQAEGRPIRVAIVTGTTDQSHIREAERLHAELILRKPVDFNHLLRWLNPVTETMPAHATAPSQITHQ